MGFGGVAAVARHVLVVERAWVDDAEYGRLLGLCQALPGANTVNAAVMLGTAIAARWGRWSVLSGLWSRP
jgi:chromate transporter